jgi:hypothetical protein
MGMRIYRTATALAAAGLAVRVLLLLAHRSQTPSILGRWSGGYAAFLLLHVCAAAGFAALALLPEARVRALGSWTRRASRWLVPRAAVLGGTLGILFLIGEGIVRVFDSRSGCARGIETTVTDIEGRPYRINRAGYRDDDHDPAKPAGTYRILVLGDSFAFGQGVPEEQTWTRRLPAEIAKRGGGTVEVINAGRMGLNTVNELNELKRYGLAYEPDLVVVSFVLNDADTDAYYRVRGPLPGFAEEWLMWSCLYRSVRMRFHHMLVRFGWIPDYVGYQRDSFREEAEGWKACRGALEEIVALSRERGARVTVLLWPLLMPQRPYPLQSTHDFLMGTFRDMGMEPLDLQPVLAPHPAPDLMLLPGEDSHPNARACGLAAGALAEHVIRIRGRGPDER